MKCKHGRRVLPLEMWTYGWAINILQITVKRYLTFNWSNSVSINLLIISVTKDFQLWGLVPESLQIMRWVYLYLCSACFSHMNNMNTIMQIVYSCGLIESWYFPPLWDYYGNQADFHYLFYDTICHSVKISHLKLMTGFIFIHKTLVLKYQLVLRK